MKAEKLIDQVVAGADPKTLLEVSASMTDYENFERDFRPIFRFKSRSGRDPLRAAATERIADARDNWKWFVFRWEFDKELSIQSNGRKYMKSLDPVEVPGQTAAIKMCKDWVK